ncbi:hypothetical protein RJ639_011683 [Escallonia herrerae]|uniref:Kinesin motor domain-containing protein n=1 Tax=Escallonia herrerae TaxID=1293975 RepID=A0AA88VTX0_9ASTE|nr:hypothetical protein RJ639_011683 [Escallonia herrerae]
MGATERGEDARPSMGGHEERIFVSVRLRPLNGKEVARSDVSDWDCVGDDTIVFKNNSLSVPERSMYPTAYTFDRVFSTGCSTRQVYKEGAKEVALSVVGGINSSIFAYGQTSSGKTYTMTGITEYTIADIYDHIQKHPEREFFLKFSAMEIYNESVRDLLSTDSTPLRLLDDPERGTIVEKLTEETLRDWDHVIELLSICEAQRQNGETSLNEASSRSHQIIRLTIESSSRDFVGKDSSSTLVAAVNFVDLAGSERASQSLTAGTRLKEGCHINRSLLTLGTVIRKLSKGRNGHIPFRDSKLTRILQSSLGGNARTAIICTMSPARSHVEQSRNTLLFASCAKEVTTNAQVNVVMSDKALVKHLQTELARLESELRSPGSTFVASNYAALLREKDLHIEKLEREINDLTVQRDVAQSQVQDMLRLVGDDGDSLTRVGLGQYPNLRVRRSPEYGNSLQEPSILADPPSMDASVRTYGTSRISDRHSGSSSDDNYIQSPDYEENFLHSNTSPRLLISSSNCSESDSYRGSEEIDEENEEQSHETSNDLCKDVRCIETEESSTDRRLYYDHFSPEGNTGRSAVVMVGDGDRTDSILHPMEEDGDLDLSHSKEDREWVSLSSKKNREVVSPPLKEDNELVSPSKEDSNLSYMHPSPEKSSPRHDLTDELSTSRSLNVMKSRSCKASIIIGLEKVENNENTPPSWSDKDFIGRNQGLPRKFSALNFGAFAERLSRKGSQSSAVTAGDVEQETQDQKISTGENSYGTNTCIEGVEEVAKFPQDKQVVDTPAKDMEGTTSKSTKSVKDVGLDPIDSKSVKDVGLDPIEDGSKSPSNWPSEFKRLQREIIELWHTCNVSLVHRTYFFLLFKGDPTDSIYMEVEIRRLSFLKDTFSRGSPTVQDGQTLTPASSMKALRRERQMLCKQMQKRLTEQDRESLYLRWGVGLNTRNRRLQLAYRLWTDAENMDHITDSAIVVAKLVGFVEPVQAPKEMFGLNFAPRRTTRSYSLKRSLKTLVAI